MADQKKQKLHAIMISIPFQGHINPFVNLAVKLASKGCTITFAHIEHIHKKLAKAHNNDDLFSEARESGLDIRYTTISDGLPLEFDRDLHMEEYWGHLFHKFPAIVDDFIAKTIEKSDSNLVQFLVADVMYAWTANIAKKYKLVSVSFWAPTTLVFSLLYHMDLLKEKGDIPCKDDNEKEITYIPGIESISTKDLMSYLRVIDYRHEARQSLPMAFQEVKKSDFILHNTVEELEFQTLSALNKYQPNYAIGPLNLATNTVPKSLQSESDCTQWLDSKPPGSVLYVSFGSLVQTSKHVIEEIAYGLLLSGVNFVCAVRAGIVGPDGNGLPHGFQDEIKDKGLIVPWCDQIRVLSNPAVGGFLTHCGWISAIESVWCGVPMICYPLSYDHPTTRKLIVDDWKIGINLCDGKLVDRNEIGEKIKGFMNGTSSKSLRIETNKLKETLKSALEVDGSSERNFDRFLNDLKEKIDANSTN